MVLSGFGGSEFSNGVRISSPSRKKVTKSGTFDRVLFLGIDGMDPVFARKMMADGELPTFSAVAKKGYFGPLRTTLPPQSPVAWSSFITGSNPGAHGIYDFIHRDPKTLLPYLSTSKSVPGESTLDIGRYQIPLDSGRVDLMRQGVPFWHYLEEASIPSVIQSLPANFPVLKEGSVRGLSGMGTPDLLGGYGTYTYFTEKPVGDASEFTGGRVVPIQMEKHQFSSVIWGPKNPFVEKGERATVPITVHRDPLTEVAEITLGEEKVILRKGEWSDWQPLTFDFLPVIGKTNGMVRVFLKSVHPHLVMYVTPVNIDPMNPALPICSPEGYSQELAEKVGRFYTQGLPADTKALNEGVLTSDEFLMQSKIVLDESLAQYHYLLDRFEDGVFAFYFSSIDQNCHMLWRCMDPDHPLYDPKGSKEVKNAVRWYYRTMDEVLKKALSKVDSRTLLLAASDHGFTEFTREFHLSTWLYKEGYISLTRPEKMEEMNYFDFVDWSKTKAYPVGINGLYLNLKGREKRGSVIADEGERIKAEIANKLLKIRDPKTGKKIIREVYDSKKAYSGAYVHMAPDLLIGYERGYRISDEAILGKFPGGGIIADRTKAWSADHCMDPVAMPGMMLSNRDVKRKDAGIWDLAPTILEAFDIKTPDSMDGKPIGV